jgi:cytochrome c556
MNKRWRLVVALSAFVGLAASPGQGPELNSVMREKLKQAQKILEAVVTSDWSGLETHSRELEQLTSDPMWMVLKSPEYARHSSAFIRAVQDLHRAAAQRDSEKAPQAYADVTLRCVECHRYLARERLAR